MKLLFFFLNIQLFRTELRTLSGSFIKMDTLYIGYHLYKVCPFKWNRHYYSQAIFDLKHLQPDTECNNELDKPDSSINQSTSCRTTTLQQNYLELWSFKPYIKKQLDKSLEVWNNNVTLFLWRLCLSVLFVLCIIKTCWQKFQT